VTAPLESWLRIAFDDDGVRIAAAPPGGEAWEASFRWDEIERVCFEAVAELWERDTVYVFTRQRPESFVIPADIEEGQAVWQEIIRRGHFDAELAIKAVLEGPGLYCWPPPPPAPARDA
jgi:hypothetical protein